jgi:hypothetical protein
MAAEQFKADSCVGPLHRLGRQVGDGLPQDREQDANRQVKLRMWKAPYARSGPKEGIT